MAVRKRASEAFAAALQRLLPTGELMQRLRADFTWQGFLLALGDGLARLHNRIAQLQDDCDPRSAVEMLPEWEQATGLPDGCITARDATTQERRSAVVGRLTAVGGASAAYFEERAAEFGYTVTVEETAQHQWRLNIIESTGVTLFRAGASVAGDPLGSFGNEQFECLMNRLKPAHTELLFAYGP